MSPPSGPSFGHPPLRRVLVTGASGFLGSHLTRRLLGAGCEVHATSRDQRSSETPGLVWWCSDTAELREARSVFKDVKPDVIFHLAGAVGADPTLERVLPTYHSLLTSTVNLLSAAAEYGCQRIILIGSFTEPLPSSPNPIPQAPYAAAKWAASAYGRMFHALHSTPVVILRPFMTYGPGQHPSKLVPSVIRSLLRDAAPKVTSGRTKADWIYVSDVIDAFLTASSAPGLNGTTLDLGTGELTTVKSVIDELAAAIGTDAIPLFGALPDRPFENEVAANTASAAERLGWRATTSLKDGLRQTVDWYRSQLS